jgi:hypothetical protein
MWRAQWHPRLRKRYIPVPLLILFFVFAIPAHAHHTKEHVLGAPSPPPAAITPAPADETNGRGLWLALGPFFALAALGALRWGYRRHREGKNKNPRS